MSIKQQVRLIKEGKISVVDYVKDILKQSAKINDELKCLNYFAKEESIKRAEILDKELKQKTNGKLFGIPITAKDDLCVKGMPTTSGSTILRNYKPPYNATCIEKVLMEKGIIIGKTCQDEFGFGSFNTNTSLDFERPLNPFDKERTTGGSSGGAAAFVQKANFPTVALAESTGGSIVNPASFCGVVGLCPTYGLVSRYGLIDYANSLDKIGTIGKTVEDAELLLDIIKGFDPLDPTSIKQESKKINIKEIAIQKEALDVDKEVKDLFLETLKKLKIKYKEVSLPLTAKYAIPAYYIIAMSEASTNLAKYCGMRYGKEEEIKDDFNEYFSKIRSSYFGREAKRRIILGTFARMAGYRDAFYVKALKARSLIIQEYKKVLKDYPVIATPTMPLIAPKFKDITKLTPLQNYMMDILTVGPNLAGLPHLSVNAGFISKMPCGIMFTGDHLGENTIIEIGKKVENIS
ncbi:Asp-tRNA(Asn)/Glu-tRNA(Gln) amidotransferase subunit GatA [Candidatus Woesearchaeota archaeon]|nr:Asp-tRNA(Asn)/Glu-tRNA(Gln) amidotransferase subunit GatA [Candidatus Woesearchaeota archaeon]